MEDDDKILLPCSSVTFSVNFQNSDPELGNMEVDSLPVLAALSLVPRPHPLALTRRIWSGEPSPLSWTSVHFCDSVT